MTKKSNSGMWDYLETTGVLEHGTEQEIKAAKKKYRKDYFLSYKRSQRCLKPEYTVNFSIDKGEHSRVKAAAQRHHLSISSFIHQAVLAYLDQSFIVPNIDQVAALEQILLQCLNEVQSIVKPKEKYHWEREQKFEAIEKRIDKLQIQIDLIFRHPSMLNHDN